MSKLRRLRKLSQAQALMNAVMGIRLYPDEVERDALRSAMDLAKPSPGNAGQLQGGAVEVREIIREIATNRIERAECLERARKANEVADNLAEYDTELQRTAIAMVANDTLIDVDGVLYEITENGVRPSRQTLLK